MNVWMYVTDDKYRLPIYVADTCRELASLLGITHNCIYSHVSKCKKKNKPCRFIKVDISDLED